MLRKLYTNTNINKTFIFSIVLYLLILYINQWFAVNSPDMEKNQTRLYDSGFNILKPPISSRIPDILLATTMIYFNLRWYLTSKKILIKFLFLITILFTMRVFIFMATETPTPLANCDPNKEGDGWNKQDIKWIFGDKEKTCIDNMFSGHAAHIVGMFLFTFMFSSYISEKIIMGMVMVAILISLVWSRLHYTSDVAVGTCLTIGYFFVVHLFL